MAEVVCVCNGVFDDDLREYLDRIPIESIESLRARERICNKCRQCEPTVMAEIESAKKRRAGRPAPSPLSWDS
ncbi:MAG: hypothetical protein EBR85_01750 [Betaproteobacteria bacterium]|jgi:bacterioferritin-associated ferredoxin|nr:hypothetical protein [Betaproteobacteria bacterium]